MFRTVPLPIIRSFSLYTQQWCMSYRFADSLRAGSGRFHPDSAPDDGQRNCPKHVEFYSKNKFEKLVHPVGFIVRIYVRVMLFYSKNKFEKLVHLLGFFYKKLDSIKRTVSATLPDSTTNTLPTSLSVVSARCTK